MFQVADGNYTIADASMEIFIIFLGAFVLGIMLGWLLKPSTKGAVVAAWYANTSAAKKTKKQKDDFKIIEWIGPKIEELLHKNGVKTYQDLVKTDVLGIEEILENAGSKFKMHNPSTWPDQARLASEGKWSELEEYQEILNGGK